MLGLNKWFWKERYLKPQDKKVPQDKKDAPLTNPINRLQVELKNVTYYSISTPARSFVYFGSAQDLINGIASKQKSMREIFDKAKEL